MVSVRGSRLLFEIVGIKRIASQPTAGFDSPPPSERKLTMNNLQLTVMKHLNIKDRLYKLESENKAIKIILAILTLLVGYLFGIN